MKPRTRSRSCDALVAVSASGAPAASLGGARARFAAVALTLAPFSAWAWDPAGHMLVDQIAWKHTSPAAREQVSDLVKRLDNQFNDRQPYTFVTAGCWMDDMRSLGAAYPWARLHYVTIPWTESGAPAPIPSPPNIVAAIEDNMQTLRDPRSPSDQRAEAAGMLLHFVADIHQPLHATDRNNDRGGNTYLITGVPFSDLIAKQVRNLHTYWDKAFRFDGVGGKVIELWQSPRVPDRPKEPKNGIIATEARRIMAAYPRKSCPEIRERPDPTAWAQETHRVGCKSAYPPGEPPTNTEARALTADFVHTSHDIATRRLALAGYRLAALLNELFASPP